MLDRLFCIHVKSGRTAARGEVRRAWLVYDVDGCYCGFVRDEGRGGEEVFDQYDFDDAVLLPGGAISSAEFDSYASLSEEIGAAA